MKKDKAKARLVIAACVAVLMAMPILAASIRRASRLSAAEGGVSAADMLAPIASPVSAGLVEDDAKPSSEVLAEHGWASSLPALSSASLIGIDDSAQAIAFDTKLESEQAWALVLQEMADAGWTAKGGCDAGTMRFAKDTTHLGDDSSEDSRREAVAIVSDLGSSRSIVLLLL